MLIALLNKLFGLLVGKLPEDKKKKLKEGFITLIKEAVKAGAEGAVKAHS